jgi:YHS domain-containing protein
MGDPVVRVYDNREVRFCCASCIEGFEADQAKYWGKIDAGIVAQQLMHYPIDSCIVTGKQLGDDSINHVHNNRLVRLHDEQALASFRADPATHLKALDKKIIALQRPGYPMDTCPVGGELGSMGEPVDFIYMNRLVRLCCSNCEKSIADDPAAYMSKLDAAYADQQRESYALESCVVTGAPLGSMGDPVELVAGTRLVRFCCDHCFPKFRENPARYLAKLPKD